MHLITDVNEYQRLALRTASTESSKWLDNAVMGLCGESGEVIDIVKKYRFQGHPLDREKLIDEASDTFWYLALLCSAIDVDLSTVLTHNIGKLSARYPDGFSVERSLNREV